MLDHPSPFSPRDLAALRTEAIAEPSEGPERALMLAVLIDAVNCALTPKPRNGRVRNLSGKLDAQAWMAADDRDWLFSFVNICRVLDFDPDYVRLGIRRMLARGKVMRQQPRRHAREQTMGRRAA
jgi:hypothetical protein